jgi:2-desacetyl-2-hydroxyethyl bacteriochlorophyllide A dehydrogenase
MKAVEFVGPRQAAMRDVPVPEVGPADVLTRVARVGVCGTDHSIFTGASSFLRTGQIRYPMRPGHEWSGVVEAVGARVTDFKPGDRVVGDTCVSCGECADCVAGHYNVCGAMRCVGTVNTWDGAYAEFMLMPARHMFHIPDGVSLDEASLVEPAATAMYTVARGEVKPGHHVVVHGTGAIGLFAAQGAKAAGAARVILTGRTDAKLDLGLRLGADAALNARKVDVTAEILRLTGGRGADAVLEASGNIEALAASVRQVRAGGVIVAAGIYEKVLPDLEIDRLVFFDITLRGLSGSLNQYRPTMALMSAGRLQAKPLITHRFPLARVTEAMAVMDADPSRIKILLDVGGPAT